MTTRIFKKKLSNLVEELYPKYRILKQLKPIQCLGNLTYTRFTFSLCACVRNRRKKFRGLLYLLKIFVKKESESKCLFLALVKKCKGIIVNYFQILKTAKSLRLLIQKLHFFSSFYHTTISVFFIYR